MRIRLSVVAMFLAVWLCGRVAAQDLIFDIQDKTITPQTTSFTLSFTFTNNSAAPIGISSLQADLVFSPGVAQNINLADVHFPATPGWLRTNPAPDTLLGDTLQISISNGANYYLPVGTTEFVVFDLELMQPNPNLLKYNINFDYFEAFGDVGETYLETTTLPGFIAVPEPGSVAVLAAGALGLLRRRRRA